MINPKIVTNFLVVADFVHFFAFRQSICQPKTPFHQDSMQAPCYSTGGELANIRAKFATKGVTYANCHRCA